MTEAGGLRIDRIDTPFGPMSLYERDGAVCALEWGAPAAAETAEAGPGGATPSDAARQLGEYFAGRRRRFDLPLAAPETRFQRAVRDALLAIPYGATRSYAEVADALGNVPRAVGQACRRNPVAVVVPCHRVVGRRGLGGYAGAVSGDMPATKRALLDLEAGRGALRRRAR